MEDSSLLGYHTETAWSWRWRHWDS